MKRIILFLLLVPLISLSQETFKITPQNGRVITALDLSSFMDTSVVFEFPHSRNSAVEGWGSHFKWIDIDTTGFTHDTIALIWLQVSNIGKSDLDWIYYTDSLHVTITDTTGSIGFEDSMFNWKYGRYLIEILDTITSGYLWNEIFYEPK